MRRLRAANIRSRGERPVGIAADIVEVSEVHAIVDAHVGAHMVGGTRNWRPQKNVGMVLTLPAYEYVPLGKATALSHKSNAVPSVPAIDCGLLRHVLMFESSIGHRTTTCRFP